MARCAAALMTAEGVWSEPLHSVVGAHRPLVPFVQQMICDEVDLGFLTLLPADQRLSMKISIDGALVAGSTQSRFVHLLR